MPEGKSVSENRSLVSLRLTRTSVALMTTRTINETLPAMPTLSRISTQSLGVS